KQLPVPPGAKVMYQLPTGTAYVTEQPVEATATAMRKLLTEQGWEPYGQHGDSLVFKQNAVELSARVLSAPGQGGKTVIDFSVQQLSVDLPAPPDAVNVQYSEPPTQLSLDVASDQDAVIKYYVERLAKLGWKPTTEKPFKVDFRNEMIFRNGEKDLLELAMHDFEGKTRVHLEYQTAEFVAEMDRRNKAAALAAIEKKKREENAPLPKVAIKLPAGAKQLSNEKGGLEFTVEVGQAKATVEAIQKQLVANGWEAESSELEAMFGNVMLKKGDQSLTLIYVETGVLAPEITVRALGMEIETTK
ncbi:MAG TPA: hypothetical protein VL096_16735, partial [Pirellulaceae bacterium]|nr:hypothetical protein [Pirellulaceae bacterium]